MRLDEHGRWVSDDGAYVWDEAAQTWQPSSAAPPASSGGASGWPDAGIATSTTSDDAAARTGGWPVASGDTAARTGGVGGVGPSFGAIDPLGLTGPGPVAGRTGATDLGPTDLGGSAHGGTGPRTTELGGRDSGSTRTGALPVYGGGGQPGRWGGTPVVDGSQIPSATGAGAGSGLGGTPDTGPFAGPAGATGAHPLLDPAGLTGPGTPGGTATFTGSQPLLGPADLTGPTGSPAAAVDSPHDSAATGEIRRVAVPGPVASTWGARDLAEPAAGAWDDDLADEPGLADDEFDDEEDGDGWAPPEPRSRRREAVGAARSEGTRARIDGFVGNLRNRPPLLIGAAVVLLCLGIGLIGYLALGGGGSDSSTAAGASAAGPGRYAPEVRQAYLSSCLDVSNGNEGYCTCTLDKLEADYSQEEYQRFSDNVESESSQRIVREIYAACRDKR